MSASSPGASVVPVECVVSAAELQFGEYTFRVRLRREIFKNKPKYVADKCFPAIITALLNTSGGVLEILPYPEKQFDEKLLDDWRNNLREQLQFVTQDTLKQCICIRQHSKTLYILVHKAPQFITTKAYIHSRITSSNYKNVTYDTIERVVSQETKRRSVTLPISGPYMYNGQCQERETEHLEFKYFECKSFETLLERVEKDSRLLKCLFGMANLEAGGDVILGIGDNPNTFLGQTVEVTQEDIFKQKLCSVLSTHKDKQTVWGMPDAQPTECIHWQCQFLPLQPTSCQCDPKLKSRLRRVLIVIHIFQCPGGMFERAPEAYIIDKFGYIEDVSFLEWKQKYTRPKTGVDSNEIEIPMKTAGTDITEVFEESTTEYTPLAACRAVSGLLKDDTQLAYTNHSSVGKRCSELDNSTKTTIADTEGSDLFKMDSPVRYTPRRDVLERKLPNAKVLASIDQVAEHQAFGLAFDCIGNTCTYMTTEYALKTNHIMDLLVVNAIASIFLFVVCSNVHSDDERQSQKMYATDLARILKRRILESTACVSKSAQVHVECFVINCEGSMSIIQAINPDFYNQWFPSLEGLNQAQNQMSFLCSSLRKMLKNSCFGDIFRAETDVLLSKHQLNAVLFTAINRFNIIEGPPGSGKTLLAQHVCKEIGMEISAYISASQALIKRISFETGIQVYYAATGKDVVELLCGELANTRVIVIDDGVNIKFTEKDCASICSYIASGNDKQLYFFQDSKYQHYNRDPHSTLFEHFVYLHRTDYGSLIYTSMNEIHRNSQIVGSFIIAQVDDIVDIGTSDIKCVSNVKGEDIFVRQIKNLREPTQENGLLKHVKEEILSTPDDLEGKHYSPRDVAILFETENEVLVFGECFRKYWPESNVQSAEVNPVDGVIIDSLENFWGMESTVVVFVVPNDTVPQNKRNTLDNPKYRVAVASRGRERVDFVQEQNIESTAAEQMKLDQFPRHLIKYDGLQKENVDNEMPRSSISSKTICSTAMHGVRPLREIEALCTPSGIDVTTTGEVLCCTRTHGVLMFSLTDATSSTFRPSPPDFEPWSVAVNKVTGDVAIVYDSLTSRATPLYLYSSDIRRWAPPHQIGQGTLPRVAWTRSGQVVVVMKFGREWYIVKYDIESRKQIWRRNAECQTLLSDVFMDDGDNIYCCFMLGNAVRVYNQDGIFSRVLRFDLSGHDMLQPVSMCSGDGGKLFTLQGERKDGHVSVSVAMWSVDGRHLQDVLFDLPDPDWPYHMVRMYRNNVLVVVLEHSIKSYNVSECLGAE